MNSNPWQKYHESSRRIEDLPDKSQIVRDYYSWLFDDPEIELTKDIDLALAISHRDQFIYHPQVLDDLFHTRCLQRLGRITQLSTIFQQFPGACHTRLEHSIATFNKKQEEHIYLWMNNPDFVKYVEDNDLKRFLAAEEIKMLYHDNGHFAFSHVTEHQILKQKGVHERIGKDTLLTDPEVSSILKNLDLYDAVSQVLETDILNSHEHDDGNLDNDRRAFVETDIAHLEGFEEPIRYPNYSRKIAKINPDGSYMKSDSGSIILTDSLGPDSKYIDTFAFSDISSVESFLSTRESLYQKYYYHPSTLARDTLHKLIQSKIALTEPEHCPILSKYINLLQSGNFSEAQQYDEVAIFKDLINLALHSQNRDIIDMVSLLFVPFENWLNLMQSLLDTKRDADFIKFINSELIHGESQFAKNIRTPDFFDKNVINISGDNINALKDPNQEGLIYNSHFLRAYKTSQPIYVEDCDGNVFPLEAHPNRTRDWANSTSTTDIVICILPLLRYKGFSPKTVQQYEQQCRSLCTTNQSSTSPLLRKSCSEHERIAATIHENCPELQLPESPGFVREYFSTQER